MTAGAADDLPPGGTRLTHSPDPFLAILAFYGRELALTLDPTRIYELALDGAQTLGNAQAALLCTRESGGPGRLLLSHNVDPALEAALCALSPPAMRGTTLTMVMTAGRPELVHEWLDLPSLLPAPARQAAQDSGLTLLMTLPVESEPPALLHLLAPAQAARGPGGSPAAPDQPAALRVLLDQVSVALRNTRLYGQANNWAVRLAALQ